MRAYRDTWHLGIHSYLSYLRDRPVVAKELLADAGSIFVQISDENIHRVRTILDEVFGPANFVAQIAFSKTSSATVVLLPSTVDHLLWYARDKQSVKFRELFATKSAGGAGGSKYDQCETTLGYRSPLTQADDPTTIRVFRTDNITSQSVGREKGEGAACWFGVFERTIGVLEPILGQEIKELTEQLFAARLTPAEREQIIEATDANAAARLADLHERLAKVNERLRALRVEAERVKGETITRDEVAAALREFGATWDVLCPREQAAVLAELVKRVHYDGAKKTVSITFHPAGLRTLGQATAEDEEAA